MEFIENNKPIYLQIADKLCDDILAGRYVDGGRIPSVRETAAQVEVNANTVVKTYDTLQQDGIIFNKRGIGYFVADGGTEVVRRKRSDHFLNAELAHAFSQLRLLGISPEQLQQMYQNFITKES